LPRSSGSSRSSALVKLAEADAFQPSLRLARREALWAIKALGDEPLPLFAAAAAKKAEIISELNEPDVALKPMTSGSEVVEDYAHVGLTLRAHPVSFLRQDLRQRRIVTCAEAMDARDGKWLEAAGLVLVRQRPGSAKGVMFITIEDESGAANLVVWVKTFEKYRRVVLSASMINVYGKVQREGSVVHLVAHRLTDLSAELASVGGRDGAFPMPHGRGDEFRHCSPAPDTRGIHKSRDIWDPTEHIDHIKVKTGEFR
jgi:error-prone DNA polymerase